MILSVNFEEIRALSAGADLLLSEGGIPAPSGVAAPAGALTDVELLRPRLTGDISIHTLADLRGVRHAVALISEELHDRMEETVLQHHPAHEEAVALYFDYGHSIAVLQRLDAMGAEMAAMIEVMTGEPPTDSAAATVEFPD